MAITPLAHRPVATPRTAAPSLGAALAAAGKAADAMIRKLDKNGDGFINEAELKPLMKKLDAVTNRMGDTDGGVGTDAARKALAKTRAKMTEGDRLLMAIATSATSSIDDQHQDEVSTKALGAGVRKAHKDWAKSLHQKDVGLMGAFEMMFAALLLPNDVLRAATKK